jgi:hypothetical protein
VSKRINEILDVLRLIHAGRVGGAEVQDLRIKVMEDVARRRGIHPGTVSDKFRRQLQPDMNDTADFDHLVESWLAHGSDRLRQIMLQHADSSDKKAIALFFDSHPSGTSLSGPGTAVPTGEWAGANIRGRGARDDSRARRKQKGHGSRR